MNNQLLALVVNNDYCRLPEKDTDFFYFESPHGENIQGGVSRQPYRLFIPKHDQIEETIEKLGAENTFLFFRVLFSFFDAAYMLFDFTRKYGKDLANLNNGEIEQKSKNYNIDDFNYFSVDDKTYLTIYDVNSDRPIEKHFFQHNEFQELFWAMNLEKLLDNYNMTFFPARTFSKEEMHTGNINLLVNKMIRLREVGMVMHTWRKLNAYNRSDFISNISNILEFIKNDLETNKESFNQSWSEFEKLKDLINMVTNSQRTRFFGIFNSSDLLGFVSRHGSKNLIDYEKVSNTEENIKIKDIRLNMTNKIMPNQAEIKHMFNYWHYTTSIIVTLWFRLKKSI